MSVPQTEVRTSFDELHRVMSRREEFRWMMLRIKRMAEPWLSAARSLASKQDLGKRHRKKVCVCGWGCLHVFVLRVCVWCSVFHVFVF